MTKLRPPQHPENFRVKVGRYGDRWYRDQLPADDTWSPMDEPVPSVTTVKNAWPKFLTNWAATECAKFAVDNLDNWKGLERAAAIDLIGKAHIRSRDASGARGNAIHAAIEGLAETGQIPMMELVGLEAFEPVLKALCDDLQPEFIASEAVAIRQGDDGYGGTLDAIARLSGYGTFLVDWKSRKAGKGGTAYPDEFAQGTAYREADYLIVAGDEGDAVRVPVPDTDGVAVITIEPEGYCVCVPDDMGKTLETWIQLRRFWSVQTLNPPRSVRATKVSAGTAASGPADAGEAPSPPSVTSPASASSLDWFNARYDEVREAIGADRIKAAWPADLPTPKHRDTWTADQLEAACALVEALHFQAGLAFPEPNPVAVKLRRKPKDSGKPATEDQKAELRARFDALDSAGKTAVLEWQGEGTEAARRWIPNNKDKTTRWTCAVNSAAVGIASHTTDAEIARGWIALVIGEEDTQSHPVGALLGSLTVTEAEKLASLTSEDTFAAAVEAAA